MDRHPLDAAVPRFGSVLIVSEDQPPPGFPCFQQGKPGKGGFGLAIDEHCRFPGCGNDIQGCDFSDRQRRAQADFAVALGRFRCAHEKGQMLLPLGNDKRRLLAAVVEDENTAQAGRIFGRREHDAERGTLRAVEAYRFFGDGLAPTVGSARCQAHVEKGLALSGSNQHVVGRKKIERPPAERQSEACNNAGEQQPRHSGRSRKGGGGFQGHSGVDLRARSARRMLMINHRNQWVARDVSAI